jgi:hypothetical protein
MNNKGKNLYNYVFLFALKGIDELWLILKIIKAKVGKQKIVVVYAP